MEQGHPNLVSQISCDCPPFFDKGGTLAIGDSGDLRASAWGLGPSASGRSTLSLGFGWERGVVSPKAREFQNWGVGWWTIIPTDLLSRHAHPNAGPSKTLVSCRLPVEAILKWVPSQSHPTRGGRSWQSVGGGLAIYLFHVLV